MPIAKAVNAVVKGEISAKDMALALMTRDKTSEVRQSELASALRERPHAPHFRRHHAPA